MQISDEMINRADSILSRVCGGIPDNTIRLALQAALSAAEPVAEIVSAHGDPEAFGERELVALVDIQKFPYRTKLYAAAPAKQEGGTNE